MISNTKQQRGFTLTELMFAMAFIAFLLVFVLTVVLQTTQIYNKGLAIRQITQSGRQLSEELNRSLRYTDAIAFNASGYNQNAKRICAGGVSYVWNLEGPAGLIRTNKYSGADASTPLYFVRVKDTGGQLCKTPAPDVSKANSSDLLGTQLTLQRFTVTTFDNDPRMVSISTVISTKGDNLPRISSTTPTGFECIPGIQGAFCAFGSFETTVYIRN